MPSYMVEDSMLPWRQAQSGNFIVEMRFRGLNLLRTLMRRCSMMAEMQKPAMPSHIVADSMRPRRQP